MIIFVRHGETVYQAFQKAAIMTANNVKTRYNPQSGLSETGIQQALEAGDCLRHYNPKHLYSSDLPRCVQTAEKINEQLNQKLEIIQSVKLRERMLWEERERYRTLELDITDKDLEPFADVFKSAQEVISELENTEFKGNVVVCTHGQFMEVLKYAALETDTDFFKFNTLYKQHKSKGNRPDGSRFCKMFAIDLSLPRTKRKVLFPYEVKNV